MPSAAHQKPSSSRQTAYQDPNTKIGQARLTETEKRRVDWAGPPENGRPNIIEAQVIKALAIHYGVEDWMAHWDKQLSPGENAEIFKRISTKPGVGGPKTKDLYAREKAKQRWGR